MDGNHDRGICIYLYSLYADFDSIPFHIYTGYFSRAALP